MKSIKAITAISILLCLINIGDVSAWNDERTHPDLSEYAADNSILASDKGNYLLSIGLSNGLEESLKWEGTDQSVKKWLRKGAELEDSPMTRSYNHFHNPLKSWVDAGLTDITNGESSLLWAQDTTNQQDYYFSDGDWTWQTVRNYFYKALTSSTDSERQEYFAKTFRGLGHQMHLIQDAAQPDHVRNDAHPEESISGSNQYGSLYFETWAAKNYPDINSLASSPESPSVSLNVSIDGYIPITQFIDTNQYNGSSPSTSLSQGIAEYTNANFFSDNTIFAAEQYSTDDKHYFPYPKKSSTDLQDYIDQNKLPETVTAEDGKPDTSFWIKKTGDGETIDHFVRPFYLTDETQKYVGIGSLYVRTFYRDETCHEDYAKKLIPKAVGYSAGLLDYFFRGEIYLTFDDTTGSGYLIENNSDEDMEGTFEVWYDDTNDNRKMVWSGYLKINANSKSTNITFTSPSDAKKSCKYILVLNKGIMGQEREAVIGKIVNPYCETLMLTGSDTTTRNSSAQYTIDGCCETVEWSVSGQGASISNNGLLTTDGTACGALKITANCKVCSGTLTKTVRVTDSGYWSHVAAINPKMADRCCYDYGYCDQSSGGGSTNYSYVGEYLYLCSVWRVPWLDNYCENPEFVDDDTKGEPTFSYTEAPCYCCSTLSNEWWPYKAMVSGVSKYIWICP